MSADYYEYQWVNANAINAQAKNGWRVVPGILRPSTTNHLWTKDAQVLMEREAEPTRV